MSPHPILLPAIETTLAEAGSDGVVVASGRRDESERAVLDESVGRLYVKGCAPRWERFVAPGRFVALPAYPWQHESFWLDAAPGAPTALAWAPTTADRPAGHPLLGAMLEVATLPDLRAWPVMLDPRRHPFLAEHRVDDVPLLAASVIVSILLAAGAQATGRPVQLEDLEFERPVLVGAGGAQSQEVHHGHARQDRLAPRALHP